MSGATVQRMIAAVYGLFAVPAIAVDAIEGPRIFFVVCTVTGGVIFGW